MVGWYTTGFNSTRDWNQRDKVLDKPSLGKIVYGWMGYGWGPILPGTGTREIQSWINPVQGRLSMVGWDMTVVQLYEELELERYGPG